MQRYGFFSTHSEDSRRFAKISKKKIEKNKKKFGKPLRIPQIFKNKLLLLRSKSPASTLVTICLKLFHESLALLDPNHQALFSTLRFGIREVEMSDGSLAILIWHTLKLVLGSEMTKIEISVTKIESPVTKIESSVT